MSKFGKPFNIFSIAFLTLFALFALIVGWLNPDVGGETGLLLFAVSYCCALVPLGLLSAARLAWINRRHLSNIFVWMAFQALFVISIAMYSHPGVSLFFGSLLFVLFPLMGFVNFWYAYKNGASLRFMGWGSIVFMWSILLAWKATGNLLEKWISSMSSTSNDLWWLYALMYGSASIVAWGLIAFLVETICALKKEFSDGQVQAR
jgi:hypothetical protein